GWPDSGSLLLLHALLMPDTPGLAALRTRIRQLGMGQLLMGLARQERQPRGIASAIAACLHPTYAELYRSLSDLAASGPPCCTWRATRRTIRSTTWRPGFPFSAS